jgi:hypothetical protein
MKEPQENTASRHVRGSFFAEYVRMVRRRKNVDWETILPPEDLLYVWQQVKPDEWYPMATFERLGLAILDHLEGATLDAVRLWGRFSAHQFDERIVVRGEPVETLMRLRVMRSTLFDFPAFDVPMLVDGHAYLSMTYHMSPRAEEAACHQTLGFCEEILTLAGAQNIVSEFRERAFQGDERTLIDLQWEH